MLYLYNIGRKYRWIEREFFYQIQKNLKQHLKQYNTEIDLAHGSVTINADNFQAIFLWLQVLR